MNLQTPWFLLRFHERDAAHFVHFGIYGKTQSFGWVKWTDKKYNLED